MGGWEYRRACRGDRREARQFMTAMRVRQGLGKEYPDGCQYNQEFGGLTAGECAQHCHTHPHHAN
jgi:hypothetical protein